VWVRIKALPSDSPLWDDYRAAQEKAEADKQVSEVEDALAPFVNPREG
jgi:hypothetical protein